MVKVTINDLEKIKEVNDLKEYLNSYLGVIPKYLLGYVDYPLYIENLKKNQVYEKTETEYYNIRINRKKSKDRKQFDKDEFDKWIGENEEVGEIILSSI